jgi:hypothetical protein
MKEMFAAQCPLVIAPYFLDTAVKPRDDGDTNKLK